MMDDDFDTLVECPSCMGLDSHCARCDSRGSVPVSSLTEDERFHLGLLPPAAPIWEGLD